MRVGFSGERSRVPRAADVRPRDVVGQLVVACLQVTTCARVEKCVDDVPILGDTHNVLAGVMYHIDRTGVSDGSTQNVTTVATWASSNQDVASVTSAGIVNAKAPGDVDITATYSGVSGKAHVSFVRPPALVAVISGTVTDAFSGGILPNIAVQFVDSRNAVKAARTDATGKYSLANIATGPVTVSFAATSYATLAETVAVSADTRIDVALERDGPISGPALVTIHAPFVYGGASIDACVPSTTGFDFAVPGTLTADEQHLTFTVERPFRYLGAMLTLNLTRTGRQLAGEIGGDTFHVISPNPGFGVTIMQSRSESGYDQPARAEGGIGADGRVSGTMFGSLRAFQFTTFMFWCSGTYQWALRNQ
jgi:hypothetical protein